MDLNALLIWTVAASGGLSLVQFWRQPGAPRTRLLLPLGLLAVLGICLLIHRESAGYVSGAVWCIFLLIPGLISQLINSLMTRRWYRPARWLAILRACLYPFSDARRTPRLIRALEHLDHGRTELALPILDRLSDDPTHLGRTATVVRTRATGDWRKFLDWMAAQPPQDQILSDPLIVDTYLQALGETHRRDELFQEYERLAAAPNASVSGTTLNIIRVKVAAFGGDESLVTELLSGPLAGLPNDFKQFWLATVTQVAGESEQALDEFRRLSQAQSHRGVAVSAQRRIDAPLPTTAALPLSETGRRVLQQIAVDAAHEMHYAPLSHGKPRRTWATWALATAIAAAFLCELPGGSENTANLIRMGALIVPWRLPEAAWWRIFTAPFLHHGPWHFVFNLAGLLLFGRWLERAWGPWLTLGCYWLAAVGSIGLAPYLMRDLNYDHWATLVGASGGVMGLVGGLLAQTGFGRWQAKNRSVAREFNLLIVVVGLQIFFDTHTPNVSSEAHLLGLAIGMLSGVAINVFRSRSNASAT